MVRDVVKAWHFHHIQYDWWYVPFGKVLSVFIDNRPESSSYRQKLLVPMGQSALGSTEKGRSASAYLPVCCMGAES